MPGGFEVVNDSGVLIIDESAVCLGCVAWGTTTATGAVNIGDPQNGPRTAIITYSGGNTPALAIRKYSDRGDVGATCLGASFDGSTWRFTVCVFGNPNVGAVDYSFQWYIFDRPRVTPSGAGVEVYDGTGQIVFSSFFRPLKVVPGFSNVAAGTYAVCSLSGVSVVNDTYEVSTPSGIERHDRYDVRIPGYRITSSGAYGAEFDFSLTDARLDYQTGAAEAGGASSLSALLVDVSGI